MSKTPIELFHDWLNTLPPSPERCYGCACQGFQAGYQAGRESLREEVQFLESQLRQANGMVMKLEAER